jgi:hypothetical protein
VSNKYDIESYLADILAKMQSKLPAKITEINAEKADSIQLLPVANESYFNNANDQVFNVDPFIYYGIVDLTANASGNKTALQISVNFEVVFNNSNCEGTLTKVLRYSRCLREVVQESFKSGRHTNLKVTELLPANASLNEGADFKVGGITVVSTIIG